MEENRRSTDANLSRLEEKVDMLHESEITERQHLMNDIAEIKSDMKGLLDAWKTANGVANFLKWMSGIGLGAAFFWELLKTHWK